jgi:hypothetical protein
MTTDVPGSLATWSLPKKACILLSPETVSKNVSDLPKISKPELAVQALLAATFESMLSRQRRPISRVRWLERCSRTSPALDLGFTFEDLCFSRS